MRHILLDDDWVKRLADIVAEAEEGDTVVVNTPARAELGRRACRRMGKNLLFEVVEPVAGDGVAAEEY